MGGNKKKKKKVSVKDFVNGRFLTEDFVSRQLKLLVLIVVLIIMFISNNYSCMKKLTEIEELKARLKDVKYENLIISTELTSNSRQSQIEELLKDKGIELSGPTTPAMVIHK
jgi:cell division protein FtsL